MIIKKIYYVICKFIAKIIFPKRKVVYEVEPKDDEPAMYCCNHSGAIGPTNMTLWFNKPKRIWIISYIFDKNVSTNFIYHDFFYARCKKCKKLWRFMAVLTGFFLRPMLEMQNAIKVYKTGVKVRDTFKESVKALKDNKNVVLFPESPTKYSEYINTLYQGFVQTGKYYYEETGKCLKFYPVYVPNGLRTINVGKPIVYNPKINAKENRKIISEYLRDQIDSIARSLPKHKPLPFLTQDYYDYYGEYVDCPTEYWKLVNQHYSE